MALQLGAVLSAFRAANVPDDIAQRASEELAGYENRFGDLEVRLSTGFTDIKRDMDRRFGELDARLERRFGELDAKIDRRFGELDAKIDRKSAESDGKINLLRWMVTFNLGLTILILGRLFGVIHG